jgi:FkbM family methyltransferase
MPRPFLLRVTPDRLKMSLFARYYRERRHRWPELYRESFLRSAPQIAMVGLRPGCYISDSLALTGLYERATTQRVLELAARGGVMVDVGANIGYFSLLWANARPENRVFAFEASPRTLPLLRKNVEHNRLGARIDVNAVAVGRESGKLAFDLGPEDQTGWGGVTLDQGRENVTVEVVRLDDRLDPLQKIDLLKIDIEGADTWALMGCERLLRNGRVREIWFEANLPRMRLLGIEQDAAAKFLASVNYSVSSVGPPSGDLTEWRAVPRAAA